MALRGTTLVSINKTQAYCYSFFNQQTAPKTWHQQSDQRRQDDVGDQLAQQVLNLDEDSEMAENGSDKKNDDYMEGEDEASSRAGSMLID